MMMMLPVFPSGWDLCQLRKCLPNFTKPWVGTPASHTLGVVNTEEMTAEISAVPHPYYIRSSGTARCTGDPVSKKEKEDKHRGTQQCKS